MSYGVPLVGWSLIGFMLSSGLQCPLGGMVIDRVHALYNVRWVG